jgi:hypothetical protein
VLVLNLNHQKELRGRLGDSRSEREVGRERESIPEGRERREAPGDSTIANSHCKRGRADQTWGLYDCGLCEEGGECETT